MHVPLQRYTKSFEVPCQAAAKVPTLGKCYANLHANLMPQTLPIP